MSQSDYIKLKKVKTGLAIKKLDPILLSSEYIAYKEYSLETTGINTLPTYNLLALPNTTIINNIVVNNTSIVFCPSYNICTNGNKTHFNTNLNSLYKINKLGSQLMPSLPDSIHPLNIKQRILNDFNLNKIYDCSFSNPF